MLIALASPESPITVDLNLTFAVQLVAFIVLTLILKPILFDPMLRLFEEREKRIEGAKLQARRIDEKSAGALTKYETEMARTRETANAERDQLRAEGVKKEQEILGAMRTATAKTLEEGRRAVHAEAEKARATLRGESSTMARDLASRVLGREVQS
jgi:F-type H+-transporting ATPase subunit b